MPYWLNKIVFILSEDLFQASVFRVNMEFKKQFKEPSWITVHTFRRCIDRNLHYFVRVVDSTSKQRK